MISYVIPTYYREELLEPQLDAFRFQTDPDFEHIISDDGAGTASRAHALAELHGAHYIWNPRARTYWLTRTLNAGIRHARGEWIVVLTNGCAPARSLTAALKSGAFDPSVLWNLTFNYQKPEDWSESRPPITAELLDGWEANPRPDWRWENPDAHAMWSQPPGTSRLHIINFCLGGAALHRSLLEHIGPFDERYIGYGCEDGAYAAHAVKLGHAVGYDNRLLTHHLHHPPRSVYEPNHDAEREVNWNRLITENPGIW